MKTVIGALLLLALATPAVAQDFDLQCRISSSRTVEVMSQTRGTNASDPYWNCNQPMPAQVPPDRWLCITDFQWRAYNRAMVNVRGAKVWVGVAHDMPTHDYHVLPDEPMATPMAFPPGDALSVTLTNGRGEWVWVRLRAAGYLGRDASATREEACRP